MSEKNFIRATYPKPNLDQTKVTSIPKRYCFAIATMIRHDRVGLRRLWSTPTLPAPIAIQRGAQVGRPLRPSPSESDARPQQGGHAEADGGLINRCVH
jgi:hypothetical protein